MGDIVIFAASGQVFWLQILCIIAQKSYRSYLRCRDNTPLESRHNTIKYNLSLFQKSWQDKSIPSESALIEPLT